MVHYLFPILTGIDQLQVRKTLSVIATAEEFANTRAKVFK